MLWASMLITVLGREKAISRFRKLGHVIGERSHADETRRKILSKVTLSGLKDWNDDEFSDFVNVVVQREGSVFAGLLRFDDLPGKDRWQQVTAADESLDILKAAVGITLWHQSQEATDCRWMRVLAMAVSGSLVFPAGAEDMAREIFEYPTYGDQRKVRPSVRANEGALDLMEGTDRASTWASNFWKQAYEFTKDDHARYGGSNPTSICTLSIDLLQAMRDQLSRHSAATTTGTEVDARHEAAFGFCSYALDLLTELLAFGNSSRILGRMALRALAEMTINFTALANEDETKRWKRFRDYGYGQAKLAYLKMLEAEELPSFVTIESLEGLANEDVWHEFREMHIGNWDESDLRKLSESVGIKGAVYDRYYDWSSAFVHVNWAALRDAEYDLCLNPLHRLHRILSAKAKMLPDVIGDAVELVNRLLAVLDGLYPGFESRLPTVTVDVSLLT